MTETARIYGGSLYALAAEENLTSEILGQMEQIRTLLRENPEYERLLSEPSIPQTERTGMIEAAFGGQAQRYLVNFMKQAIAAVQQDVSLPVTLYQSLADEMVTDIGVDKAVYLTTQALTMPLDSSRIMMLKADTVQGNVYDEVYVDDDALYDLILNVFYTEEKMEGTTE